MTAFPADGVPGTPGRAPGSPTPAGTSAAAPARARLADHPLFSYYLLVGVTLALLAFGLMMVLSATSVTAIVDRDGSAFSIFVKQASMAAVGLAGFVLAQRVAPRFYRVVSYPLLFGALVLLVLVPFIGVHNLGATRWIAVGPIQLQPSEIAKLALILWAADLYARKEKLLTERRHLLMPFLAVAGLMAGLVLYQKDLGTTTVIAIITFAMLWTVGAPARVLVTLGALGAAGAALVAIVEPYRFARVQAWLQPELYADTFNYQSQQGLTALASGGWFGHGLGASRQKWQYLPEHETDFIFAIVGEELGLVGTLSVVALFGLLAYAGLRIARRTPDLFGRLVATCVVAWLVGQALVNMATVVRLVPVTGIPLPLISVGGTSLIVTLTALGILACLARREPGAAQAWAERPRLRHLVPRRGKA